jgi:hypothetical protein
MAHPCQRKAIANAGFPSASPGINVRFGLMTTDYPHPFF